MDKKQKDLVSDAAASLRGSKYDWESNNCLLSIKRILQKAKILHKWEPHIPFGYWQWRRNRARLIDYIDEALSEHLCEGLSYSEVPTDSKPQIGDVLVFEIHGRSTQHAALVVAESRKIKIIHSIESDQSGVVDITDVPSSWVLRHVRRITNG